MLQTIALVIHVFLAIGVIGLVLIQHGKGADAGAAFGSGASATVFGSKGSGSFLTRMTTFFALAFFATSMLLFFLASQRNSSGLGSVIDDVTVPTQQEDVPLPSPADDTTSTETDLPAVPAVDTPADSDDVPAVPDPE